MLTIPSTDLHGCISDAVPFISPDKDDDSRRVVELRWDGNLFHAAATSRFHAAVSSWDPDDPPEQDVQGELGADWGSDDEPWSLLLTAEDVKHLLDNAKPSKGHEYVPLFLTYDLGTLMVRRAKQAKVPGFSLSYDGADFEFPDVRQHLVEVAAGIEETKEVAFNPHLLAALAKVRMRGACAKFSLGGASKAALVEIGGRFVGAIAPVKIGDEPPASHDEAA